MPKAIEDDTTLDNAEPIRRFFASWSDEELRRSFSPERIAQLYQDMKAVPAIAALKDNRKTPTGILRGNLPVFLAIEIARRSGATSLTVSQICRDACRLGYKAPGDSKEFLDDPVEYMRGYVTSAYKRRAVVDAKG